MKLQFSQGITLLELIISLTIIIILTVTAVPLFFELYKNHRLASTAESLYYTLQFARSEAVKRNSNVYVSFTTGDSWCYGVNVGSTCNCATSGSCSLGSVSAPSSQTLSLSAVGLGGSYVYFEGTHGAANASGSLTFTLYGGSNLITTSIGRLGSLQICSTGLSGYTSC